MTPPPGKPEDLAARMARTAAGRAAPKGSLSHSTTASPSTADDVLADREVSQDVSAAETDSPPPAKRRGQGSRTTPAGESSVRAFVSAPKHHARRVTLDLTDDDHRALSIARVEDGVPVSERLRALVKLWRDDPSVAERALRLARGE